MTPPPAMNTCSGDTGENWAPALGLCEKRGGGGVPFTPQELLFPTSKSQLSKKQGLRGAGRSPETRKRMASFAGKTSLAPCSGNSSLSPPVPLTSADLFPLKTNQKRASSPARAISARVSPSGFLGLVLRAKFLIQPGASSYNYRKPGKTMM